MAGRHRDSRTTNEIFGGRNGDPIKAQKEFNKKLKAFKGTGIGVGNGLSPGPGSPIYRLSDEETVINCQKDAKTGNYILSPKQIQEITNWNGANTDEECDACDGEGVVGCDYCDVCGGTGRISRKRTLIFKVNGKEVERKSKGGGRVSKSRDWDDDDDD